MSGIQVNCPPTFIGDYLVRLPMGDGASFQSQAGMETIGDGVPTSRADRIPGLDEERRVSLKHLRKSWIW